MQRSTVDIEKEVDEIINLSDYGGFTDFERDGLPTPTEKEKAALTAQLRQDLINMPDKERKVYLKRLRANKQGAEGFGGEELLLERID